MSTYYPIFLKLNGAKCVIVGGGEVAERKARALLEHGASVTVITAQLSDGLARLAQTGQIEIAQRQYKNGDLDNALIAIAATDDPKVNRAVAREGQRRRILTNVVDDPDHSDFIVPSLLRRGDLSIAVSTGGKSPALARKIRSQLEQSVAPEYAALVGLLSEVRHELRSNGVPLESDEWQARLNLQPLLDLLKKGEIERAKERLIADLRGQ